MSEKQPIRIRDLYPDFPDEQLAEAETKLRRFAHVLAKIYEEHNVANRVRGSPRVHVNWNPRLRLDWRRVRKHFAAWILLQ